jgi:uncharacterized protein
LESNSYISPELIATITEEIKHEFSGEGSGHDWWHIQRVVNSAVFIAQQEGADEQLVQLAALVHDLGDHKFHSEVDAPERLIGALLLRHGLAQAEVNKIITIVNSVSYKGAGVATIPKSLEAKCVQDADRLDAIGAIGIARAFAYGGNRNRLIYDPEVLPVMHPNFQDYKNDKGHTINHFYEKLLLLKDRMQTKTGRKLAEERHSFMELFLQQFFSEWKK